MIKLSDIFRNAAENLPKRCYCTMWHAFQNEIHKAAESAKKEGQCPHIVNKKRYRLWIKGEKILNRFKPRYARKNNNWIGVRRRYLCCAKNGLWVDSVEEAQYWRKIILLKCAEIADSEVL